MAYGLAFWRVKLTMSMLLTLMLIHPGMGVVGQATSPAGLAYVSASGQSAGANAGNFHPLNLLDDDANTVWCAPSPEFGKGQEVTFVFKRNQRIDRIVINPSSRGARMIDTVRFFDGARVVSVAVGAESATNRLDTPLFGDQITMSVERLGEVNNDSPFRGTETVCLADILLYNRDQLFGGKQPAKNMRYDERLDQVLGRWNGGELGAPEKQMTFALDGTWEWSFQPMLGGTKQRASGEYRFRGSRLFMRKGEMGRWSDMGFRFERVSVDPMELGSPRGNYSRFELNSALGDLLGDSYNNAEF